MKGKITNIILTVIALSICMCLTVSALAPQGTKGDELEVLEAEQLEIQLGTNWAGVEFQLRTDAGLYPGTIPVGADGILKLEIGGRSSYILSCMDSVVPAPSVEPSQLRESVKEDTAQSETTPAREIEIKPDNSIPVVPMIIFCVGMVIAVVVLILMSRSSKKKRG